MRIAAPAAVRLFKRGFRRLSSCVVASLTGESASLHPVSQGAREKPARYKLPSAHFCPPTNAHVTPLFLDFPPETHWRGFPCCAAAIPLTPVSRRRHSSNGLCTKSCRISEVYVRKDRYSVHIFQPCFPQNQKNTHEITVKSAFFPSFYLKSCLKQESLWKARWKTPVRCCPVPTSLRAKPT